MRCRKVDLLLNYKISKNSHVRNYTLYRISATMRSLEICTQRLFSNSIKENQKLRSPVNISVQRPENPGYRVQLLASRVKHQKCRVQSPTLAFRVQEFRYAKTKIFETDMNVFNLVNIMTQLIE